MKRSIIIAALTALANINVSAQTETKNASVDYNLNLNEVVVKSTAPKTRMKNGAMVTRIEGTVLESAGTAEEMLSRVPGMMRMGGQLQVIGKGTPIYYINGRKVEDPIELQRLQSTEIKEVEVIRTPGAQYNADANAIVKIRTVKREGEGWGLLASINDSNIAISLKSQEQYVIYIAKAGTVIVKANKEFTYVYGETVPNTNTYDAKDFTYECDDESVVFDSIDWIMDLSYTGAYIPVGRYVATFSNVKLYKDGVWGQV